MTEPVRSPDDRTPRWSEHMHESLDAHEAQAAELRRELDDLRRTLGPGDAGAGGSHRRPKPPRRVRVLRALVVLVVLAVVVGLAVLLTRRAAPAAPTAGAPAPSAAPTAGASPAASAAPSAVPSARRRAAPSPLASAGAELPPWPGRAVAEPAGLPSTGPGADTPGSEITVALDPDRRHVEVYERALLAPGSGLLALRPADAADVPAAARSLVGGLPGVQNLHAVVDGRAAVVTTDPPGWTVIAPAGVHATRLVLRYRLDGALARHEPSPAGRYTLVLRPLTPSAGRGAGTAVVVRILDDQVTELYCPGASDQLCGATAGALHTATVPRGSAAVVIGLVTLRP